jgi:hypothetical protein
MEEKHDIVAPVFKAKGKPVSKGRIYNLSATS